jgi:DNA-directed RNA polymerase specialized sigma24 family protein
MTAERPNTNEAGSVTRWIPGLQDGDRRAVQALWGQYFEPMVRIAQARLRGASCQSGAEDVAVEAFLSFCSNVQRQGRFPDLSSRENLLRLLIRFTVCKAFDFRRREERRHAIVRGESALGEAGFEPHPGDEPPPEFQAQVASLLDKLPSDELREIALLRLEGLTNREIADELGRGLSTVELKLSRIRGYWKADWAALHGEQDAEHGAP